MTTRLFSLVAVALLLSWLAACGGGGTSEEDTKPDTVEEVDVPVDVPDDKVEVEVCEPACTGKECGPNGCGGTCAPGCGADEECNSEGNCIAKGCDDNADCLGECASLGDCEECVCSNKKCITKDKAGCCEDDNDCDDDEACDTDANTCYKVCDGDNDCKDECGALTACEACVCGNDDQCEKETTPAPACCLTDGDCDADQECDDDHKCVAKPVVCSGAPDPAAACVGKCGNLTYCQSCGCNLDSGNCEKLTEYGEACCTNALEHCDDGNEATDDRCPEPGGKCQHPLKYGLCPNGIDQIFFQANFDQGSLAQFEIFYDNDDEDQIGWQLDAYESHSGAYSLYFGDPLCHTYYSGALGDDCLPLDPLEQDAKGVEARIQSEYVQLGSADDPCVYALTFWAKFEGEETWTGYEEQTFDQLKIFVKDGTFKDQVFASAIATENNSTEGDWKLFAADLTPYWGKTVRLVFEFDSIDGSKNFYFGAMLDDVVVRSVPGASQCISGGCPADGLVCTSDLCTTFSNSEGSNGVCAYFKDAHCEDCPTGLDSECNAGGSCELGDCVNKVCDYALDVPCCKNVLEGTVQKWDFDAGKGAWKVTDASATNVTWREAPGKGPDGTGAMYFGNPTHPCTANPGNYCPSYDNGEPVHANLESDTFILQDSPAYTLLTFDLWLSTEWDGTPLNEFDNFLKLDRLSVYVKTGPVLNEVWTSDLIAGSTYTLDQEGVLGHEFERVGVDISQFKGKAVSIVFAFDSGEYLENDFEGAYVDNISLVKACAEPCLVDADCFDGKPCTTESCQGGICDYQLHGQCCANQADCDDANECTVDTCQGGLCKHAYSTNPACCSPGQVSGSAYDFENGSLDAFTVDVPADSATAWHVTAMPETGSNALWFGNAETATYENVDAAGFPSAAVGAISFPSLKLPLGGLPVLEFDLYLDTEWAGAVGLWEIPGEGSEFDKLSVFANNVEIWNSFVYEVAGGAVFNRTIQASLADVAGENVILSFRFDSQDGDDNAHPGVFVDNVRITWYCVELECFSSFECDDANDDGDICTQDRCDNKQCFFQPTGVLGCCYPLDHAGIDFEGTSTTLETSGGSGAVKWQVVDNGRAHNGTKSLYFGDVATKTYDNPGLPVAGDASWALQVPPEPGYMLEWWQWLDLATADLAVSVSDVFRVHVWDPEVPGEVDVVFENKPSYGLYKQWAKRGASLDKYVGKQVWVFFTFESGDAQNNAAEGIYLDDLRVYKSCP
jgi:hypothetical protein